MPTDQLRKSPLEFVEKMNVPPKDPDNLMQACKELTILVQDNFSLIKNFKYIQVRKVVQVVEIMVKRFEDMRQAEIQIQREEEEKDDEKPTHGKERQVFSQPSTSSSGQPDSSIVLQDKQTSDRSGEGSIGGQEESPRELAPIEPTLSAPGSVSSDSSGASLPTYRRGSLDAITLERFKANLDNPYDDVPEDLMKDLYDIIRRSLDLAGDTNDKSYYSILRSALSVAIPVLYYNDIDEQIEKYKAAQKPKLPNPRKRKMSQSSSDKTVEKKIRPHQKNI